MEKSIRTAVQRHLHLGSPTIKVRGKDFSIGYSVKIARKMLAAGMDPDDLVMAVENIRFVRDVPPDEPLTMAYLESQPAILNQAISEGHKRAPVPEGVV